MLDPAHIAPSRSDPNSNGHFPAGPGGQPIGTPRGFSLNNFQGGYPGMPGMMPGQPGMGMMPGMGMPGMPMTGMAMGMGGVGPMRTQGGGRMNGFGGGSRMAGPYTRNDGRGRQQSKYPWRQQQQQAQHEQHEQQQRPRPSQQSQRLPQGSETELEVDQQLTEPLNESDDELYFAEPVELPLR